MSSRKRRSLGKRLRAAIRRWQVSGKTKYFCIGRNKTGTTSLKHAFQDLGFIVGSQPEAERLTMAHYFDGEFDAIIDYCRGAQVFQDVPFSYPETYKHLDKAFPGSKFILSVRDDAEQWYRSLTRFHAKRFGTDGQLPTAQQLKDATYVQPGRMYSMLRLNGTTDEDPYNKDILIANYERHNREVIEYFKDRPDDLLVINVSTPGDYLRLVEFIGVDSPFTDFPWENRT